MPNILIIGLGNPGKKFEHTRHNVGHEFILAWVDTLRDAGAQVSDMKLYESMHASLQEITYNNARITVLFPNVFMNESGKAVMQYLRYDEIDGKNILVVHDDLELPLGEVKYQESGSAHGHNGMRSIHEYLGTTDIPQLRIGISRPADEMPVDKFVLGKFTSGEQRFLDEKKPDIFEAITAFTASRLTQE